MIVKMTDKHSNPQAALRIIRLVVLLTASGLFLSGCGGSGSSDDPAPAATRPFYMGFTPWPYDATSNAVNDTYTKIQDNGDMVAHHLDGGIPWQEALAGSSYHASVEAELNTRLSQTQSGKVIYLAVGSLNNDRSDLAGHWGAGTGEPLSPPWNGYAFDHPDVISAYINFSLDLIQRFNPSYFNYAIEINELMVKNPTAFDSFVTFAQQVYTTIKAAHPSLPIMVSLALKTPGSAEMLTAQTGFARIKDYVDLVGISSYGYVFYSHADKGDPANLPSDWLSQISVIAPGKPVAVAETGWIAEDLVIPAFGINENGNASLQDAYLQQLFEQAGTLDAEFLIWFFIVDFDAMWSSVLGSDDLARIWRDTGLYDETLQPREGLARWQEWLSRKRL